MFRKPKKTTQAVRQVNEAEPLVDFIVHIRSFMRGGAIDFPLDAKEMDTIDDELGKLIVEVLFHSDVGRQMNALLGQEKSAAKVAERGKTGQPLSEEELKEMDLVGKNYQPLTREEQESLSKLTEDTYFLYLIQAVKLLKNKLMTKVENKYSAIDKKTLRDYIKSLNSTRDEGVESTGRQLAVTLKFIYENQNHKLPQKDDALFQAVKGIKLNQKLQDRYKKIELHRAEQAKVREAEQESTAKLLQKKEKAIRQKEINLEKKHKNVDVLSRSMKTPPTPRTAEKPLAKSFDNLDNFFGDKKVTASSDDESQEKQFKPTKTRK